jgi:threonyl-tRNA synthetase
LAVGAKEKESNSVAVRKLGEEGQKMISLEEFVNHAKELIKNKK